MIITLSGTPGSGKSTIAKAIAKTLDLKHYSAGDLMRQIAESKKITLMELLMIAKKDPTIDTEVDERTKHLGQNDNFVIDSRLAFHFIPKAIKLFVTVDPKAAAHRVYLDLKNNKRATEKELKTEKQVLDGLIARQKSESARYKKYYNLDYLDPKNYDFVLDTTNLDIEQCVKKVLDFVKK